MYGPAVIVDNDRFAGKLICPADFVDGDGLGVFALDFVDIKLALVQCNAGSSKSLLGDVEFLGIAGHEGQVTHGYEYTKKMQINLKPGSYVVAVSGGVDSVALLHMLQSPPELKLVVAHFDHGIRPDSRRDRLLVQALARRYGLPFLYDEGSLGSAASEATAREARYTFLYKARSAAGADAIVTAHHKDDLLETAIINIIRGTGRKGLAGLRSTDDIMRPLLHLTKEQIGTYAREHGLEWHEDSTNLDTDYLRNYVRRAILPRFSGENVQSLHDLISRTDVLNESIDREIDGIVQMCTDGDTLDRRLFRLLPHTVAREVMAAWLRNRDIRGFDKKMLERLTHAAKIQRTGREVPVYKTTVLRVYDRYLALATRER
jgi:tRNA(Ile)-lysidine synthetase-like protein